MSSPERIPLIAVSMGDPAGIGPEICLRLLSQRQSFAEYRPVVIGDATVLKEVANRCQIPLDCQVVSLQQMPQHDWFATDGGIIDLGLISPRTVRPGQITQGSGAASFAYVEAGIALVKSKKLDALVTAPIHKEAWKKANVPFPGHTEMLADRTGTDDFCMMMCSPYFSCSLVTTHVGLGQVIPMLTTESIVKVTQLTHQSLLRILGYPPKLVMLGLNPHAGEGGLFGNQEEERIIIPALEIAQQRGIQITGPLPADTAFIPSIREATDGYICMYHDQGLIPFKAFNFDSGVNITLGLPIIRTSVDHGTAFDIAWQGVADWASLRAAAELAARLSSPAFPVPTPTPASLLGRDESLGD